MAEFQYSCLSGADRCVINDARLLIFPAAHTVCLVPRLDTSRMITITISPSSYKKKKKKEEE